MIVLLENKMTHETLVIKDAERIFDIPSTNEIALVAPLADGELLKRAVVISRNLFNVEWRQDV